MPKPGPRPYDCVRKAWHSDRHQPIRGSLIQEIFRIVNEIHGSSTKKNTEWQEKLPIVVLRTEEIMYSKANSEAEYMDLKTLWGRLNEAIDTIIRRDDTTESESGDLLQPCIEAALHLGCSPKRSSRSQMNTSPRYYLSPVSPDSNSVSTGNSHDRIRGNPNVNTPLLSQNSNPFGSEPNKMFTFTALKFPPPVCTQDFPMQTARATPNSQSLYPLYYACPIEPSGPKFGSRTEAKSNAQFVDGNKKITPRSPLSCNLNSHNKTYWADSEDVCMNQNVSGCNLSLCLGFSEVPSTMPEENKADDAWKLNDLPPQFNRGLSFFSKPNAEKNQFESSSRKISSNVEPVLEKRKMAEDQQIYWPVKLPFNKFRSLT